MTRKLVAHVGGAWPSIVYDLFMDGSRFDSVRVSSVADLRERPPDIVFFTFSFPSKNHYDFQSMYDIHKWCQDSKIVTILLSGEAIVLNPRIFDWTFSQYLTDHRNMLATEVKFKFAIMYPDIAKRYNCWGLRNEPKTKFCYFLYKNSRAIERIEFAKKLMRYKRVDCMGIVLNNMPQIMPWADSDGFSDLKILKDYKFGIAFENHSRDGYITEKIFRSYLAGAIPIYWGDRRVTDQINPAAFINCHDFANFDEVVAHVIEVDNDPNLYQSYVNAPLLLPNSPILQNGREQLSQRFDEIIASIDKIHPISTRRFYLQKVNVFYHLNMIYSQKRIARSGTLDDRVLDSNFLPYVVVSAWYFRYWVRKIYKFVFGRWPKLDKTLTGVVRKIYRLVKKRRA